jgi:hypothetical protein
MVWKFGMELFIHYTIKKETPQGGLSIYQPITGAVRATGVASAAARSRGKLCFHFGLYLHHTLMRLGVGRYWCIT